MNRRDHANKRGNTVAKQTARFHFLNMILTLCLIIPRIAVSMIMGITASENSGEICYYLSSLNDNKVPIISPLKNPIPIIAPTIVSTNSAMLSDRGEWSWIITIGRLCSSIHL